MDHRVNFFNNPFHPIQLQLTIQMRHVRQWYRCSTAEPHIAHNIAKRKRNFINTAAEIIVASADKRYVHATAHRRNPIRRRKKGEGAEGYEAEDTVAVIYVCRNKEKQEKRKGDEERDREGGNCASVCDRD